MAPRKGVAPGLGLGALIVVLTASALAGQARNQSIVVGLPRAFAASIDRAVPQASMAKAGKRLTIARPGFRGGGDLELFAVGTEERHVTVRIAPRKAFAISIVARVAIP